MNTKAMAKGAAVFAGPLVLAIGASLMTLAIMDTSASGSIAAPAPTVTVTSSPRVVTAPPTPPASPTQRPTPTDTLVAERLATRPPSGSQQSAAPAAGGGGVGAEQTSPSGSAPASCSGRVASVRLPLGVLPTCAVTVGGSR